ncbi:MAG: OmpA family protein [Bryobacteraceae bacterium]|nr:OmpA family protein [Bryobacteraceae bacterium]
MILFIAGCRKKPAPAPPPPPPPPPAEVKKAEPAARVVNFAAEPSTIERGQSSTLRWNVENATSVTIEPGIGTVPATGSRQVFPTNSTTYTLRATGPGGGASATASVTVTAPPPPPPPPPTTKPTRNISEVVASEIQDALFDYDKSDIREDARSILTRNADALKSIFNEFPGSVIQIEGHCDERGSAEYNLGLGDRRAAAAKEFLVQLGVPADRLKTISYGKERPQCTESDEGCWQKNRRAHFVVGQ